MTIFKSLKRAPTDTSPTQRDAKLRKRDEARIAELTEDRDKLQRAVDAGYEGTRTGFKVYEKRDVEHLIRDPHTQAVTEVYVDTVVTEKQLTDVDLRLNWLNSEIDKIQREMEEREAVTAADRRRAELRRADLPREEAELRGKIQDAVRDLLPIIERIAALQEDSQYLRTKYGKRIGGYEVGVPEITTLVNGHLSLPAIFSSDNSRFNLWLLRAKRLGLDIPVDERKAETRAGLRSA